MRAKLILYFFCFTLLNNAQVMWQIKKDTVITWLYQEGDEFNDSTVNTNYWDYNYGWGRSIYGNKEQQYYTDGKNHTEKDGLLSLDARRETIEARIIDWRNDNDSIIDNGKFNGLNKRKFNFSAGMIQSKKEFLYGYYEIKFKMPEQKGFWPAFWLYGGTPNEEIDFLELKTERHNQIHVAIHGQKKEDYFRAFLKKKAWGDWVKFKGDLKEGFNIIAGEWTKDYIKYYLNGELIAYVPVNFNVPKKLVANIAVPANDGPFKPGPDDTVSQSGPFQIDYIRVWSNEPTNNSIRKVHSEKSAFSNTNAPLNFTSLKTKKKFIYGKKSYHNNEGITVSCIRLEDKKLQLVVLGKVIPADAVYELLNNKGEKLKSGKINYGEIIIDCADLIDLARIKISAFGKECYYSLVN